MTAATEVQGFPRPDGTVGCRNHLLVLPTVVCAGLAASQIAGTMATAVIHQHGCDHVGDDAAQVRRVFSGLASNPNVAGCLLVGLGCETIQGQPLLDAVAPSRPSVAYLGIQDWGGSANAVADGRAALRALAADTGEPPRRPVPAAAIALGIAAGAGEHDAVIAALAGRTQGDGARVIAALPRGGSGLGVAGALAAGISYGDRPPPRPAALPPVTVMACSGSAAEQHTGLAAAGAQVIVSLCGPRQAPLGSPVCPVISVARDAATFSALPEYFDIDGSAGSADALAERIWPEALSVFCGQQSASERRGAREFGLQRVSRST